MPAATVGRWRSWRAAASGGVPRRPTRLLVGGQQRGEQFVLLFEIDDAHILSGLQAQPERGDLMRR